jgi:hypothetical protein
MAATPPPKKPLTPIMAFYFANTPLPHKDGEDQEDWEYRVS